MNIRGVTRTVVGEEQVSDERGRLTNRITVNRALAQLRHSTPNTVIPLLYQRNKIIRNMVYSNSLYCKLS